MFLRGAILTTLVKLVSGHMLFVMAFRYLGKKISEGHCSHSR